MSIKVKFSSTDQKLKAKFKDYQRVGGVTSWNDLTDKPFGEVPGEGVLEFNGDLTDREYVAINELCGYVKVSDKVLTESEVIGSTMTFSTVSENLTVSISADMVDSFPGGISVVDIDMTYITSVREPSDDYTAGTYFLVLHGDDGIYCVRSISCLTEEKTVVKPIDEKYLPDSVKGKGVDIIHDTRSYTVGETEIIEQDIVDAIRESLVNGNMPVIWNDRKQFYPSYYEPSAFDADRTSLSIRFIHVFRYYNRLEMHEMHISYEEGEEPTVVYNINRFVDETYVSDRAITLYNASGSKKFKITVDDSGTLVVNEVTT